jgi:hypothetical protein
MEYKRLMLLFAVLISVTGVPFSRQAREYPSSDYLSPKLRVGEKLGNMFSRTISYKVKGADEYVRRVSGTAIYSVIDSSPTKLILDTSGRYDGRPEFSGKVEIRDGGRTSCYNENCSRPTDASGLLYSPIIWGDPSQTIRNGSTWKVAIVEPWELGPPGTETVTVLSIVPESHTVTLQREGTGSGFFDNDLKQIPVTKNAKSYPAQVEPGPSHWNGYTVFREGVVISDELLVERPVTLHCGELGDLTGFERQYILLNAMPVDSTAAVPVPTK